MNTRIRNPRRRLALVTVSAATGGALLLGAGFAATAQADPVTPVGPIGLATARATVAADQTVDADVAATLQHNREEERLARDVYAALADRYGGAAPFSRITRSEQNHFDAIGVLLNRYGIADPSAGRAVGDYADPTLRQMYDDLMKQGSVSLDSAYDVGITIERQDVADLGTALAGELPADVRTVLTNLRTGSEHHLAAFENAANGGVTGGSGYGNGPMGNGRMGRPDESAMARNGAPGYGPMSRPGGGPHGVAGLGDGTCLAASV